MTKNTKKILKFEMEKFYDEPTSEEQTVFLQDCFFCFRDLFHVWPKFAKVPEDYSGSMLDDTVKITRWEGEEYCVSINP